MGAGGGRNAKLTAAGSGPFHHRLTTSKDMDNHSKVAEALRKMSGTPSRQADNSSLGDMKDQSDEEAMEDEADSDKEEEEEDSGKEEETDRRKGKEASRKVIEEDDEEEEVSLRWKSDLATKARDAFYARQSSTANLRKLVYGHQQVSRRLLTFIRISLC